MNNKKIINLADGVNDTDVINKKQMISYIDSISNISYTILSIFGHKKGVKITSV